METADLSPHRYRRRQSQTKTRSVRVEKELLKRVQALAKREHRSLTSMVDLLLSENLDRWGESGPAQTTTTATVQPDGYWEIPAGGFIVEGNWQLNCPTCGDHVCTCHAGGKRNPRPRGRRRVWP